MPLDYPAAISAIEEEIAKLSEKKKTLLGAYALTLTDIRVGDWVKYANSDYVYEVRRVYMKYDKHLTFVGSKIKKDGTPSAVESELWHSFRGPICKVARGKRVRRTR